MNLYFGIQMQINPTCTAWDVLMTWDDSVKTQPLASIRLECFLALFFYIFIFKGLDKHKQFVV
jgi:hypothetical protein